MMHPKGYATDKDLIQRVADQRGLDFKTVEHMYKFITKLIRAQATQTHVLGIQIPHVGIIYQKKLPLKHKLQRASDLFKKGSTYKRMLEKYEYLLDTVPGKFYNLHIAKPLVESKYFTDTKGYKAYEEVLNKMQDREKKQQNFF
jgi:hypothetical protein